VGTAGFFVTGSGPLPDRTAASCALIRGLRSHGIDTGAMKPIETGTTGGQGGPAAARLGEAAGGQDAPEDVCPFPFSLAAVPAVAARAAGRPVDLEAIDFAFSRIAARRAAVVVEGCGGLLAPLGHGVCSADLAARLGLPLILAESGAGGVIERTALVVEAALARDLPVAGFVLCGGVELEEPGRAAELEELRGHLGGRWLGAIEPQDPTKPGRPPTLDVSELLTHLR
jgi:dethiobiotin synthetase